MGAISQISLTQGKAETKPFSLASISLADLSTASGGSDYNRDGIAGGAKYLAKKLYAGGAGTVEGIIDFTVGGIASLVGNDAYAKKLYDNNYAERIALQATEEYNPNKAMTFAGDVASGIGQSFVGTLAVGVAAGMVALSGGTAAVALTPLVTGIIAGTTVGLGAAGQATAQAYQKTGELGGKEYLYGAVTGLEEGVLEGILSGAVKATKRVISPLAKTGGKTAKSAVSSLAKAAGETAKRKGVFKLAISEGAGEFVQEFVQAVTDPLLQRGLGIDPNAENVTLEEATYQGFVGFVSGAVMSVGGSTVSTARKASVGSRIIDSGRADGMVQSARQFAEYASNPEFKDSSDMFKSLTASLNAYDKASDKTGARAKVLLGEISQSMAYIEVRSGVAKSREAIQANAEGFAALLGVSVEDIRADKDRVATKLAINDFAGQTILPEEELTRLAQTGQAAMDEATYIRWSDKLDAKTKAQVGAQLGLDLNTATYQDMTTAMQSRRNLGSIPVLPETVAIPKGASGVFRTAKGEIVTIQRTAKGYILSVDDAKGNNIGQSAKPLIKQELDEALRQVRSGEFGKPVAPAEANKGKPSLSTTKEVTPSRKAVARPRVSGSEADTVARKYVKEYDTLPSTVRGKIQELIISAKQFDVSEGTVKAAANIIAVRGLGISFSDIKTNGIYYTRNSARYAVINPNLDSDLIRKTLIHELTHDVYGAKGYDKLAAAAVKLVPKARQEMKRKQYQTYMEAKGLTFNENVLTDEVTADFFAEAMAKRSFLEQFAGEYDDIFGKVKKLANSLAETFKPVKGEGYVASKRLADMYNAVVHEQVKTKSDKTRYSLNKDNIPAKTNKWINATGDIVQGDRVKFTEAVFTGSFKNPKFAGNRTIVADVINDSYGADKQQHTFTIMPIEATGTNANEITIGKNTTRKGRNIYKNGTERLEWQNENQRDEFADEKHNRGNAARAERDVRRMGDTTRFSIPETDSEGKKLSDNQREFFKDSKVVDDKGRLLKVYHGTNAEFTVFNKRFIGASSGRLDSGTGFYFSKIKSGLLDSGADWYGDYVNEYYLNIKNPFDISNLSGIALIKKIYSSIGDIKLDNIYVSEIIKTYNKIVKIPIKSEKVREGLYGTDFWIKFNNKQYIVRNQSDSFEKSFYESILPEILDFSMPARLSKFNIDNIIRNKFDGVINDSEIVAFSPNQIKLTTNLNPTENEDIRYSLPEDSLTAPKRSEGQLAKYIANNTREKIYDRTEAENAVNRLLDRLGTEGYYGTLKGKSLDEITDALWIGLNKATGYTQDKIAGHIADLIIENSTWRSNSSYAAEIEYANYITERLTPYFHKLDLRGIQAEIRAKYGTLSAVSLWSSGNSKGTAPDVAAQELISDGLYFGSDLPSEILFEMQEMYEQAKDIKARYGKAVTAKDVIAEGELNAIRIDLVKEILKVSREGGSVSKYARLIKIMGAKYKRLRAELSRVRKIQGATNKLLSSIDRVKSLEKYASASVEIPDEVKTIVKALSKLKTYRGNLSSNVRLIMRQYTSSVKISDGSTTPLYNLFSVGVSNPFADDIIALANGQGFLSAEEMLSLDRILLNFIHEVSNYRRVFFEGKKQDAMDVSSRAMAEINRLKVASDSAIVKAWNSYKNWVQAPVHRFERLGMYDENSVMAKFFGELRSGVDKQADFGKRSADLFAKFFKTHKKEVNGWSKTMMKVGSGEMTRVQAISLYMLSLRAQALPHIYNINEDAGIIRVTKDKAGITSKTAFLEGKDIRIERKDVEGLYARLTAAEKQFVDLAKQFFELSKDAKTETDMSLYGVSNAVEKDYFPIRVSEDAVWKNLGDKFDTFADLFTVYSPSFNKNTMPSASNKIVIENALDVVNRHSKQMGAYYGLAGVIKNLNRIYNIKQEGMENVATLRQIIMRVDPTFETWFSNLLLDIQGRPLAREGFDKMLSKIRGWGAAAALGFNPKVIANQMVSMFAARGNSISYRNIFKGIAAIPKGKKADYETLYQYAPMLYERAREGGNVDVGALREETGLLGKIGDVATKPIGKMDSMVVFGVWNAAIEQTRDDAKYAYKSDEHYKAAARLAEETVIKTQANYIALYRPDILRTKSSFLQLSTMFMSEPLQVFSQMVASVDRYRMAKYELKQAKTEAEKTKAQAKMKTAVGHARGIGVAVLVDSLMLTMIAQTFRWIKNSKEEEEPFLESFANDMLGNFTGMFPIVRDIHSYLSGYDITNMYYTGLEGLLDTIKFAMNFDGSKDKALANTRKVILNLSQVFGIPLRNIEGYAIGILSKFSPRLAYKYNDLFYAQNYSSHLSAAVEAGDDSKASLVLSNMLADRGAGKYSATAIDELLRLYKTDNAVTARKLSITFSYDGTEYSLTSSQYGTAENVYKQAAVQVEKLIASTEYDKLTDEGKKKAINEVLNSYYAKAVNTVIGVADKATVSAKLIDVQTLAAFKGYTASVKGKAAAVAYVKQLRSYSTVQKMLLLLLSGYSISSTDFPGYTSERAATMVKAYIKASSLSTAEKTAALEACGLIAKTA